MNAAVGYAYAARRPRLTGKGAPRYLWTGAPKTRRASRKARKGA